VIASSTQVQNRYVELLLFFSDHFQLLFIRKGYTHSSASFCLGGVLAAVGW